MDYTSGPWQYRKGDVFNADRPYGIVKPLSRESCIYIDGDDRAYGDRTEVIAEVCDGVTAEADARLIAAAPDLLAALKALVHYDEGSSEQGSYGYEVLQRCKDAISKAEGRAE
jgi:hypothetical protein